MADSKITALTAISTVDPAADPLVIVDVSDTSMAASGTTKKATINQLLGASGTATLASATITGDLTVDTSTLYVSSSADKVGIGTTSLSNEKLTVAGNISANAWLGRSNIATPAGDCSIFRSADNTLGFGIASSTAMTLNANGLGIGVTPSAWPAASKALDIDTYGANYAIAAATQVGISRNCYYNGTNWIYKLTTSAQRFEQDNGGGFKWFTAAAGAAGTAIGSGFTNAAMTLDASGNLLVAGTSAYIRAGGRTQIVGGSVVDINTVGNNVGIAFGGASSILPCDGSSTTTDGVANFGSASKRWNTIYASTGTINTSDQNEKQDIADLGDAEKRVAGKIKSLVKKYRFKDAVASKGENARIHVGWIAQDVQNAFSSEGLDASKYGVFCSDTWEENGVQKTRLGLRYDEVLAFVVSAI